MNELDDMLADAQDKAQADADDRKAVSEQLGHVTLWDHGWVQISELGRGKSKGLSFYTRGPNGEKQKYEMPAGVHAEMFKSFVNTFYQRHTTRVK